MTKLQTLQKLQNRAARTVIKSIFDTPAPAMIFIRSLKWPTVSDFARSETAIRMVQIAKWGSFQSAFPTSSKKLGSKGQKTE